MKFKLEIGKAKGVLKDEFNTPVIDFDTDDSEEMGRSIVKGLRKYR